MKRNNTDLRFSEEEISLIELQASEQWRTFYERCENGHEFQEMMDALLTKGQKGLEPYLAKFRTTAVAKAERGDMSELAELVRKGTIMNDLEREFAAECLMENAGDPRKNYQLTTEICLAFFWLHEVEGIKSDAATAECGAIFGLKRSRTLERRKEGEECAVTQEAIAARRNLLNFASVDIINYFKKMDLKSG